WFVDLASVADPALLTHVIAQVLEVREEPGWSPMQNLVHRLRDAHMLLVLDNCENLLDACAELAASALGACPHVHLLAISREPLKTDGDTIWRVPPLSSPSTASADQAEVVASEAVQLFVRRARAHDEQFSITDTNSAQIGAICRHLDG